LIRKIGLVIRTSPLLFTTDIESKQSDLQRPTATTNFMMTVWTPFVYLLMPIGFFTLLLLSLPLPNTWSVFIARGLLRAGSTHVPYTRISFINCFLLISLLLFSLAGFQLYKHQDGDIHSYSPNGVNRVSIRWRAERNFWMTVTNFIIYWSIFVIHWLKTEILQLTQRNE